MTREWGTLCVAGVDAKKLLQGQLTCNLDDITEQHSMLGAHCNPQGRVISLFHISLINDVYHLQMPTALLPIAENALKKYAMFFKVTLSVIPRSPEERSDEGPPLTPLIYPETSEKFLPHELNLDTLGAISFNKGCYTGQEIIARMHYRGKLKKRLYRAKVTSDTIPQRGADIVDETGPCGSLVDFILISAHNYELFIVLSEEDVQKPLFLENGCQITLA